MTGGCKLLLFSSKLNTYCCRHVQSEVTTTYYPNPNQKKGMTFWPRNPNPNPNPNPHPAVAIRRWIAALGLGLGFLA